MRATLLAGLLVLLVGGGAWMLDSRVWSPEPNVHPEGPVTTLVARDSSGNGHHGIIQGPVELGLPGRHGTSFSFARRDSWLMVPPSPDLNPREHDFLVSAWVSLHERPGPGETYDVVRKGISYTASGVFRLEVLRSGRVRCLAEDDKQRIASVTTRRADVIDGRWHRIGCARTGRLWSALADDTVTSRTTELGVVGNEVPLSIGAKYGSEDRPDSRVDDVRFVVGKPYYEGTTKPTRLEALEQGAPTARWRLDESSRRSSAP